jgi:hypothetical protein
VPTMLPKPTTARPARSAAAHLPAGRGRQAGGSAATNGTSDPHSPPPKLVPPVARTRQAGTRAGAAAGGGGAAATVGAAAKASHNRTANLNKIRRGGVASHASNSPAARGRATANRHSRPSSLSSNLATNRPSRSPNRQKAGRSGRHCSKPPKRGQRASSSRATATRWQQRSERTTAGAIGAGPRMVESPSSSSE